MRRTESCACLSRCSNNKGCGWWSHSICLSIYLFSCFSFSYPLVYRLKRRGETNVYMSFGWQTLPFLFASPPFPYHSLFFRQNKVWRIKTCVRCYHIQQCMFLSSKTLSAISAFCLTSCLAYCYTFWSDEYRLIACSFVLVDNKNDNLSRQR